MSITLFAMAAATTLTHHATIDHHGTPVRAVYAAQANITARTVGARAPNRMDMQRCNWTARIVIDRRLGHGPALARTITSDKPVSGSENGACSSGNRLKERVAARYQDHIQAQLMAAVEQDRSPLLAELDSVRSLASN